jgi:SAM-dependent methyltransferase
MGRDIKTEYWINKEETLGIEFSNYWNVFSEEEKNKPFNILDGNFDKLENYLKNSNLEDDLLLILDNLQKFDGSVSISGRGLDIAAGNCWASKYLFEFADIKHLTCVDYSHHRLMEIGPLVIDHYNIPKEKVTLAFGSFYELKIEDRSMDFVFLCQAFHHASCPETLLGEISRVLKDDGVVIIVGEHVINESKNKPNTDLKLGDHYYYLREYLKLFDSFGFFAMHAKNPFSIMQNFILQKR